MTDETPKPKRKRWRWIIAGVLLFVFSVAGWWYWPRSDARFVGKWEARYGPVVGKGHLMGILELRSNGFGVMDNSTRNPVLPKMHFKWESTGDTLHLGVMPPGASQGFWQRLSLQFKSFTGASVTFKTTSLTAESISEDTINFGRPGRGPNTWPITYLSRIPE